MKLAHRFFKSWNQLEECFQPHARYFCNSTFKQEKLARNKIAIELRATVGKLDLPRMHIYLCRVFELESKMTMKVQSWTVYLISFLQVTVSIAAFAHCKGRHVKYGA